jgi:hypothetical protein
MPIHQHIYFKSAFIIILIVSATFSFGCPRSKPSGQPEAKPVESNKPLISIPGTYLVYTVNDPRDNMVTGRKANVLIADPLTQRREILFEYPGFIFHLCPSPDGKSVAFVGSEWGPDGGEVRDLFLYDIKKKTFTDVSASGHFSRAVKTAPIFSSDSSDVLFLSQWTVGTGEFNIFKCNTETLKMGGLYTDPVEDTPLTLVPDSRLCVAVRRIPNVLGAFEFISVDIDTGEMQTLHRFDNVTKVGPAFFDSTGSTIYCDIKPVDPETGGSTGIRSRSVVAIDMKANTMTELLDPLAVSYVYQVFPDAAGDYRMLLRRQEGQGETETPMSFIATVRTDGTDFKYLTNSDARCYLLPPPSNIPPLSPDYSLLFYYRQDPVFKNEDIWVMKPDGTEPVNISNTAGYPEGSAGWIVIR